MILMSLKEKLNNDMKNAMKSKEKEKLTTIRMVKASIQNEEIKLRHELTEDEELTVLSREVKQRKESLEEFEKAGRADLVEKIKGEISVLEIYLPQQLSEEEVRTIIKETIEAVGATSKKDMGKLMQALMPKVKGKVDGKLVNKIASELL
jgi:uncharacterized protein YqeY